jgi:ADP-dependent NAD(P)H-hydrate dehydratase
VPANRQRRPSEKGKAKVGGIRRVRTVPHLSPRHSDAHKGNFGHVLVIGGSRGMIGAPALVANAALRSGAGLVTVACPESVQIAVATLCPCATSIPLPEIKAGLIDPPRALRRLRELGWLGKAGAPSALAAGPGLGQGDLAFSGSFLDLLRRFREEAGVPSVIDADALNAMASVTTARAAKPSRRSLPPPLSRLRSTIITPHPGEMARLHDVSTAAVQQDREGLAIRTARQMTGGGCGSNGNSVVVLKGAKTVVTDGDHLYINRTGNPGMATGGSGDVLTGVLVGLVAQGLPVFDAAVLGVHVHGLAGDMAAKDVGETSLIAADLVGYLPEAFLVHADS